MADQTSFLKPILRDLVYGVDAWKEPVKSISTTNVASLSGAQTIGGVSCISGDSVLLAGQTTGSQNGIWTLMSGAWARRGDADASDKLFAGVRVSATQGTNAGATYRLATTGTIRVGITSQAWEADLPTGGAVVTNVTGTSPVAITTPSPGVRNVAVPAASGSTSGLMSIADYNLLRAGAQTTVSAVQTGTFTAVVGQTNRFDFSSAATINLPTAVGIGGQILELKRVSSSTGIATIDAFGTQTIDGQLIRYSSDPYGGTTLRSDNANWMIVGRGSDDIDVAVGTLIYTELTGLSPGVTTFTKTFGGVQPGRRLLGVHFTVGGGGVTGFDDGAAGVFTLDVGWGPGAGLVDILVTALNVGTAWDGTLTTANNNALKHLCQNFDTAQLQLRITSTADLNLATQGSLEVRVTFFYAE